MQPAYLNGRRMIRHRARSHPVIYVYTYVSHSVGARTYDHISLVKVDAFAMDTGRG